MRIYNPLDAFLFLTTAFAVTLLIFFILIKISEKVALRVEYFRVFGATVVAMIALLMGGFNIPKVFDKQFAVGSGASIILLSLVLSGVAVAILWRKTRNQGLTGETSVALLLLLLILPSLDGNLLSLYLTGRLSIIHNALFIIPVAFTVITGPGSWSIVLSLPGDTPSKLRKVITLSLIAYVVSIIVVLGLGTMITHTSLQFLEIIPRFASVAILISSFIISKSWEAFINEKSRSTQNILDLDIVQGLLGSIPIMVLVFTMISVIIPSIANIEILFLMAILVLIISLMDMRNILMKSNQSSALLYISKVYPLIIVVTVIVSLIIYLLPPSEISITSTVNIIARTLLFACYPYLHYRTPFAWYIFEDRVIKIAERVTTRRS